MARRRKILPARRKNAIDDSLLMRSAESLGRIIGSLQRQLDAARSLTHRADGAEAPGNGHAPVREGARTSVARAKTTAEGRSARTTKTASPPKKTAGRGAGKRRSAKAANRE